jgi:hypothetical protein
MERGPGNQRKKFKKIQQTNVGESSLAPQSFWKWLDCMIDVDYRRTVTGNYQRAAGHFSVAVAVLGEMKQVHI